MKEESMYSKYKSKKITIKEYHDYLAQKRGFKNRIEYLNWWAQQNGFRDYSEYNDYRIKKKYKNSYEYSNHLARQNGFKNKVEYQNWWLQQNGFRNINEYLDSLAQKKGFRTRKVQYYATPNGRLKMNGMNSRRRELGYNIINKDDSNNPNYVGHHINKEDVLFIPSDLHKSIKHKQSDKESIDKINNIAFEWYFNK